MDFLTSFFNYSVSCNFDIYTCPPAVRVCTFAFPATMRKRSGRTNSPSAGYTCGPRTAGCGPTYIRSDGLPHVCQKFEVWIIHLSLHVLDVTIQFPPPLVMGVSTQTPHDPGCGIQYQKAQKCALHQFVLVQILNLYLFHVLCLVYFNSFQGSCCHNKQLHERRVPLGTCLPNMR